MTPVQKRRLTYLVRKYGKIKLIVEAFDHGYASRVRILSKDKCVWRFEQDDHVYSKSCFMNRLDSPSLSEILNAMGRYDDNDRRIVRVLAGPRFNKQVQLFP